MGVDGAASVLHKVDKLTLDQVVRAGKLLVEKHGRARPVTIILDASWVGMEAMPHCHPVDYTIDALKVIGSYCCHCIIVSYQGGIWERNSFLLTSQRA